MTSTHTQRKRFEKQGVGENNNAWGGYLNLNTIDLIDESFGVVCVAMTTAGDSTLSTNNGLSDEGRRSQIFLTGTPTSNVRLFVPAVQSFYLVRNKMAGTKAVKITNLGGTNGVEFSGSGSGAEQGLVVSDGTNVREVIRTVSIGGFPALTSTVIAAVSDSIPTDATGGNNADLLPFFDKSETGGPLQRVPVSTFFKNVLEDTVEETAIAVSDGFWMYDQSTSAPKLANPQNLFKVFNSFTEETTPNISADYILAYNTSVGAARKILMNNASKGTNVGTKTGDYTATTSDRNGSVAFAGLGANATLTLPTAASFGYGNILWFANEDTSTSNYTVTVDPNGAETIDGQSTRKGSRGTRAGLMAIVGGWKTIVGNWVFLTVQQTVTGSDTAAIAHGQPRAPDKVNYYLICLSTDLGYSAGENAVFSNGDASSTASLGLVVTGDATNMNYKIATNGIRIIAKSTGAVAAIDTSKWALVITGEW